MTSRSTNNSSQSLSDESTASQWPLQCPNRLMLVNPPLLLWLARLLAFPGPRRSWPWSLNLCKLLAAERTKTSSSPATSVTSNAIGGVPAISTPTVNVVQPSAGRPVSTSSVIVPSFLPTFTAPALPAISLVASAASSLGGSSRDAGNACLHLLLRSWLINRSLLDLLFPDSGETCFSDRGRQKLWLCNLFPANLQAKEPEPQLLFDNLLVLTTQPKKSCRRVEDIATWTEALAIFSFILVSRFPHYWRDLLQYQLVILRRHRHFFGRVWLAYDRAFREHAAATQLTDWSCMNASLFNFHVAGASVRSPSSTDSFDWEPTGSSGSTVICKSWNRGRCTSPLSICGYEHRYSYCSGSRRAAVCPTSWPKYPRGMSPSTASSSSGSKSRRV